MIKQHSVVLCLLLSILVAVDGVTILSATHQRELVDSLRDRFELGIYEVEFDKPLSVLETYGHCDYECSSFVPTCTPCDYSDPLICAGSRANDALCPCPISAACNMTFIGSNEAAISSVVENGEQPQYFAFFIELFAFNGDLELSIALAADHIFVGDAAFDYYVNLRSRQQNPDSILLCPIKTNGDNYLPGTYLVRISASETSRVQTGFSLSLRNTPLPKSISTNETCVAATSNHTCLKDDTELYMIMDPFDSSSLYFSMQLPVQCPLTLTIYSNHPYALSLTNPFPDFLQGGSDPSTLFLELSSRERNVQALCITQENTFLYLTVPSLQTTPKEESTLSIRISSNPGLIFTRKISDYPAHALPFALSASSFLHTPQERFMCDSYEVYENGCSSYWHLYSGQEVNPLVPSPPRVIRDNVATLQGVTIPSLDSNKYAVAVVLSERPISSYGFRRMTVDDFEAGRMFFTRLADSQGKPIMLNTTFVPKQQSTCNYRRFNEHHRRITEIMTQLADFKEEITVNSLRLELNALLAYDSYRACQSLAEGFIVTETSQESTATDRCVTSWDDPEFDNDPCCIQPSNWKFTYKNTGPQNSTCTVQNVTFPVQSLAAVSSNAIADQCASAPCVENLVERYFQAAERTSHPLVGCDANFISYEAFSELLFNYSACDGIADSGNQTWCLLNNTFPSVLDRLGTYLNVTIDTTGTREEVLQQWFYEFQYVSCSHISIFWDRMDVKNTTNACPIYRCNYAWYNSIELPYDTAYEYCVTNANSPQFCGECTSTRPYCLRNSDYDENTCAGARCQLPNATSIPISDQMSECQNKQFCSLPCSGGDCATEQDCMAASTCNDDFFDYTVGKCIDTSSEDFECGQSQYDNNTAREFVSGIGCYEPLADETQCLTEVPGGRWVKRSTSETECTDLNRIRCYTDDTNYFANLTISECNAIGGDPNYYVFGIVFRWKTAEWSFGRPFTLRWLNSSLELMYGTGELAWDITRLQFNGVNVISNLYSIEQSAAAKSNVHIDRTGQASELINAIACSCAADGERSSACFEQYNPAAPQAQQVVCRGVPNYIFLQQGDVSIDANDVYTESSICTLVQNSIVSASEFEITTNNELSNFFLHFSRDTKRIIQNKNNATIGKIVSDGLAFDFSADAEILRARICMAGDIEGVDVVKFGVADVGLADWKAKSVTPMSLPVIWNGTHYCATVYNITDKSVELNTNIFFFIQRVEDWEEQKPQMEFTTAELGLIITLIICYAFTLGFSVYRIIEMIRYHFVRQIKILIYCFLAGLFFVRLLYFLLLVGNVFVIESRGDYVLIELPSFLYFSTLSIYVIVWAVSLRSALDMGNDTKKLLQRVTIIVNGSIYMIFILLIILYETLRPAPAVECNGLLVTNDLTTSAGIALAYRLFVTSISFALMLCFAIYGIKATRLMARNSHIKSKNEAKNKTLQTTAISASGLLIQCLYFLLLLVVNYQNNILSLAVLLVVEIGVGVTLLVLTDVKRKSSSTSGTQMQSKTGSSTNSSGGNQSSSKL